MLGRTAQNLFWLSRYVERSENMARLLDAGLRMALTRTASSAEEWNSVVASAGCATSFRGRHSEVTSATVADFLLRDATNPSSVLASIDTARSNAAALGLAGRSAFVACSYAAALRGPFDLIVSNPPYIPSGEIPKLSIEVREHDPHLALDGGNDGYDAYRALIPQAAERLAPGGALIVEAGQGQARDIETLMAAAALTVDRPPRADLAGIPRAVSARKMPP